MVRAANSAALRSSRSAAPAMPSSTSAAPFSRGPTSSTLPDRRFSASRAKLASRAPTTIASCATVLLASCNALHWRRSWSIKERMSSNRGWSAARCAAACSSSSDRSVGSGGGDRSPITAAIQPRQADTSGRKVKTDAPSPGPTKPRKVASSMVPSARIPDPRIVKLVRPVITARTRHSPANGFSHLDRRSRRMTWAPIAPLPTSACPRGLDPD